MSELSETPFRLYMIDGDGDPVCICATDEFSLGEALLDLWRQGRISVVRGIMYRPHDDEPGEWFLNPWEPPPAVASGRLSSATTEGGAG